jgi:hypothetical protein
MIAGCTLQTTQQHPATTFYSRQPCSGVGQRHHNRNSPGSIRSGGFLIRGGLAAFVLDVKCYFARHVYLAKLQCFQNFDALMQCL